MMVVRMAREKAEHVQQPSQWKSTRCAVSSQPSERARARAISAEGLEGLVYVERPTEAGLGIQQEKILECL